jgi:hypothetical protein
MNARLLPSPWGRIACAALLAGTAIACNPVVNAVRVDPGTVPREPVFVLSDTTGRVASGIIYGLSVLRCGTDSASWTIAANGSVGSPGRVVYGTTPPGYVTVAGPEQLRVGCYNVYITDGRRARFQVDRVGRVLAERLSRDSTRR